MAENEAKIVEELNVVQGVAVDLDGYYFTDDKLAAAAMRPSQTFNNAISGVAVS